MNSDSSVITTVSARALASRINGAKSRGPRTAAGKARSSRNALKHGLCAQKILVLPNEDAAEFKTLQTALVAELAPVGTLQAVLAQRVVSAAWRLVRADRLEAEVLEYRNYGGASAGVALMRDGNGTRSVETVMRYRGAAVNELLRALKTLQALQAEARAGAGPSAASPVRPRRLLARRNDPEKAHRINGLTENCGGDRRQNAADRDHPAARPTPPPSTALSTKPAQNATAAQPLAYGRHVDLTLTPPGRDLAVTGPAGTPPGRS